MNTETLELEKNYKSNRNPINPVEGVDYIFKAEIHEEIFTITITPDLIEGHIFYLLEGCYESDNGVEMPLFSIGEIDKRKNKKKFSGSNHFSESVSNLKIASGLGLLPNTIFVATELPEEKKHKPKAKKDKGKVLPNGKRGTEVVVA